jgi:hypothetical protein
VVASSRVRTRTHIATVPLALGVPWTDVTRLVIRAHLVLRDGPWCHYCSTLVGTARRPATIDHVWPVSRGRVDHLWNFVLACSPCNSTRGAALDWCSCAGCARAAFLGSLAAGTGLVAPLPARSAA